MCPAIPVVVEHSHEEFGALHSFRMFIINSVELLAVVCCTSKQQVLVHEKRQMCEITNLLFAQCQVLSIETTPWEADELLLA